MNNILNEKSNVEKVPFVLKSRILYNVCIILIFFVMYNIQERI